MGADGLNNKGLLKPLAVELRNEGIVEGELNLVCGWRKVSI